MAIVAEIFAAFPGRFRFISGTRTPAQNAAAGGVANSYHLTGQAADFVAIDGHYPPGEKARIAEIVARHGYEVLFHNSGSGIHYHIEPAPGYTGPPAPSLASANQSLATSGAQSAPVFPALLMLGVLVVVLLITD